MARASLHRRSRNPLAHELSGHDAADERTAAAIAAERCANVRCTYRQCRIDVAYARPQRISFYADHAIQQIGRASCRERVYQYGTIPVVAATFKKTKKKS